MMEKDQTSIEVLKIKIRDAYRQQKHSECIEFINGAPECISKASQYKILKASCINNIGGRSREAHEILESVIVSEPDNAFAYYSKGLVFINDGVLDESVKCFTKAIEIDPSEKMNKARQFKSRAENMLRPIKKEPVRVSNGDKRKAKRLTSDEEDAKHCGVCQKSFAKTFSLTRHMLLHTGERPHKCHVCGYAFIQKSDLSRHLATHSDVANFQCTICLKRFKTKKNLHCHSITHSTLRPFKCDHCGKTFKIKRLLVFHERMHANDKPYTCDICGKGFQAKQYINCHLKTHFPAVKKTEVKREKLEPMDIKTEIMFEEEVMDSKRADHIIRSIDRNDSCLTFGDIVYESKNDSDLNFCLSLLKDISRMTDEQKVNFKASTIAKIHEMIN